MQNYIDYRNVIKPLSFNNFTVEIGFGSGDFLVKMAKENSNEIFFGIEKSWIPVNKLLKKCNRDNLNNIFCVKLDAYWAFQLLFDDASVKKVLINYPDPWFKKSHISRRLTTREKLYIYAKKLVQTGEIRIRSDDYLFVEFTLKESKLLQCFSCIVSNPAINEPVTKYEKKWLSMNKDIYDIILKKEKEPFPIKIKEIKEILELFPVKVLTKQINISSILYQEFKIEDNLYLKCFSACKNEQNYTIEAVLLDNDFLQSFIITVKKKNDYFIIDVSQFSEILKTEGVQKALHYLAQILFKETI